MDYQCEQCRGVFTKARADDEAWQETKEIFGDVNRQDCAIVCDDCFNEIMGRVKHCYFCRKLEPIGKLDNPCGAMRKHVYVTEAERLILDK